MLYIRLCHFIPVAGILRTWSSARLETYCISVSFIYLETHREKKKYYHKKYVGVIEIISLAQCCKLNNCRLTTNSWHSSLLWIRHVIVSEAAARHTFSVHTAVTHCRQLTSSVARSWLWRGLSALPYNGPLVGEQRSGAECTTVIVGRCWSARDCCRLKQKVLM